MKSEMAAWERTVGIWVKFTGEREKKNHMAEYINGKSFHPGTKRSKRLPKPKHRAAFSQVKAVLY